MIDATLAFLRDDIVAEEFEQVDLAAIVATIAAEASDAGQIVNIEIPRHLILHGRHLALKRVLTNLIQNAVKYGGAATVTGARSGETIRLNVRDDRPGIPHEELVAVFEPFVRLEPSRGRSTGGHGLGLTVAQAIVRAHGGDVILANQSPGGLDVRVTLPIAPRPI